MARVVISHPDGRSYSVEEDAFERLYAPKGFTVVKLEEPRDFIADAPPVPRRAGARRKSTKPAGSGGRRVSARKDPPC